MASDVEQEAIFIGPLFLFFMRTLLNFCACLSAGLVGIFVVVVVLIEFLSCGYL